MSILPSQRKVAREESLTTMRISIDGGYEISRIIKGGWQLAGDHGPVDPSKALQDMAAFVESGITTFDCADIYTGVEELIGEFRARYPSLAREVQIHTKCVPDLTRLASLDARDIERTIDRSLLRLGVERLDLVQFHWWDYAVPGYVEAAAELTRLRAKGKIARLGVTNFDVPHLTEMLDAGLPVISIQGQYSLLDQRPRNGMMDLCRDRNLAFFCYGTVAGGFLSERWVRRREPGGEITNRSLIKYKLIIDEFGGWELFQRLLQTLERIAVRHNCDIATVAAKAVLDRDGVSAVIVGATNASHLRAHTKITSLKLDATDMAAIDAVLKLRRGPQGDLYSLERDRDGRHGRIMKYNLND
jgi:aryl-alcohol dehydrogenase-like predicted oxidoreductase